MFDKRMTRQERETFWTKRNAEDKQRARRHVEENVRRVHETTAYLAARPKQPCHPRTCCIVGCEEIHNLVTRRVNGAWAKICKNHAADWTYTPDDAWNGFMKDLAFGPMDGTY